MTIDQQRKRVTAALFFSLLLLWGSFEAQPVFVDALLREFHWSHVQVSWIPAISSLGIGVIGPIAGRLLDRHDARYVMSMGALLIGAGLILSAFCGGLVPLIAATAVYGIGLGAGTVLPASLVVANWYEQRRRGTAIGLTLSGMEVGGMVFTFVAGAMIALHGWRTAYIVVGVPAIVLAAPLLFLAVRSRPQALAGTKSSHDSLPGMEFAVAVRTRTFWGLAGVQTASGFLIGGVFPFLISYFIGIGYSSSVAVMIVTASYGVVVLGKPLIGLISDRLGSRNALLIGFFCWIMVALGLMAASKPLSGILFLCFIGFALPAAIAVVPAIIAKSLGLKRFGSIYGSLAIGNTLGLTLGPIAIGILADVTGSYPVAFRSLLVVAVLGGLSALLCGSRADTHVAVPAHG